MNQKAKQTNALLFLVGTGLFAGVGFYVITMRKDSVIAEKQAGIIPPSEENMILEEVIVVPE